MGVHSMDCAAPLRPHRTSSAAYDRHRPKHRLHTPERARPVNIYHRALTRSMIVPLIS